MIYMWQENEWYRLNKVDTLFNQTNHEGETKKEMDEGICTKAKDAKAFLK